MLTIQDFVGHLYHQQGIEKTDFKENLTCENFAVAKMI